MFSPPNQMGTGWMRQFGLVLPHCLSISLSLWARSMAAEANDYRGPALIGVLPSHAGGEWR
jgi:hypothetical protein